MPSLADLLARQSAESAAGTLRRIIEALHVSMLRESERQRRIADTNPAGRLARW